MKLGLSVISLLIIGLFLTSCGGASRQTAFKPLVKEADSRVGESDILGGYILDTRMAGNQTHIIVLQAPLGMRGRPQAEVKSQGSFLVVYNGTLDPNDAGRKGGITVTGTVLGTTREKRANCPEPCLKIESSDLHVWPEYQEQYWGRPTDGPGP